MRRSVDEVVAMVREAGHERLADRLRGEAIPAIVLRPQGADDAKIAVGASKFGGSPDLSPDAVWPVGPNWPMAFLAQVNLADASRHDGAGLLPSTGLISFFYDFAEGSWGFNPADRGSFAVLYSPDIAALARRDLPPQAHEAKRRHVEVGPFPPRALAFEACDCVPTLEAVAEADPSLNPEDGSLYELQSEVWAGQGDPDSGLHQMLGHPYTVQNSDIRVEAAAVAAGMDLGGVSPIDEQRLAQAEEQAENWVLLLQLDSDDDAGWMWGDVGLLYFLIRKDDMARRDFSKAWCILQCG